MKNILEGEVFQLLSYIFAGLNNWATNYLEGQAVSYSAVNNHPGQMQTGDLLFDMACQWVLCI